MSSIASPFFNPDQPRTKYLDRIPKWCWPFTCRCRKDYDLLFDTVREMMVCENCRLPPGFQIIGNSKISAQCMSCGNDFVLWNRNGPDTLCNSCGGTNEARKGQRTIDPNDISLPEVD